MPARRAEAFSSAAAAGGLDERKQRSALEAGPRGTSEKSPA
ncbi:MAG: hypothetical protein VB084_09330 [Syntrophomonadaceae bacterium]|nr:hypothetical protein [Syntrophomonadaceae bacterium]